MIGITGADRIFTMNSATLMHNHWR